MKRGMVAVGLGLWLGACGGSGGGTDAGAVVDVDAGVESDAGGGGGGGGDVTRGMAVAAANGCAGCHGAGFEGGAFPFSGVTPSNITPDPTNGVGAWTDAQIVAAIRAGTGEGGRALCGSMPRFTMMSDGDAADLVAFIRSRAASSNDVPAGTCTAP